MEYIFVDAPICPTDRRSAKQKKIASEQAILKRSRWQELFSVEELVKMGFYESQQKKRPHGVEFRSFHIEKMDKDWYDLQKILTYQIDLYLPEKSNGSAMEGLNPCWLPESESYVFFWRFRIYGNAILWVAFDLLHRILQLPYWDSCKNVPLFWKALVNEKTLGMRQKVIKNINEGSFTGLSMPSPPLVKDLKAKTEQDLLLRYPSESIGKISNKAMVSHLRHYYTPYDYLWQTSKMKRDEAKGICEQLIESKYPHLFEEKYNAL